MSFKIEKHENLDKDYFGYSSKYSIEFFFEKQGAVVSLEIYEEHPKRIRLKSETDGYHWLQFFLCQEPGTLKLEELEFSEEILRCKNIFKEIGIEYQQEGKYTAFLTLERELDLELVNLITEIIEHRFANRERFFD